MLQQMLGGGLAQNNDSISVFDSLDMKFSIENIDVLRPDGLVSIHLLFENWLQSKGVT